MGVGARAAGPPSALVGTGAGTAPIRLHDGAWTRVDRDTLPTAVARSALEAARAVVAADFCVFVWRRREGPPGVVASTGVSYSKALTLSESWLAAALREPSARRDSAQRSSPTQHLEPVRDSAGRVRGVLVAALGGTGVRPRNTRLLMPVFASHLGLLLERSEADARRTDAYEALVQIGMQIQAEESNVDHALHLIVERARDLVGTDLAWLGLVDDESQTLVMRVAIGAATQPFMQMRLNLGDGVGGVVVATRRPVALPDYRNEALSTPTSVREAVLGEGVGSMLCAPMLCGEKVVGALYVGSRHALEFSPTTIALISALAAQAAVALVNGRLYEQLQSKNDLLERSFGIHRALTDVALAGAGAPEICTQLAGLLEAEVALVQEVVEPFYGRYAAAGLASTDESERLTLPDGLAFPIVGDVELGRLHVLGIDRLSPLQEKAVEHGATVLALELVKQQAAHDVEWQLQGDLLNELLDARVPLAGTLTARARRHGVDLSAPHRIVVVEALDRSLPGEELLALVRRVTGRGLLDRDAALVNLRGDQVVLASRSGDGDADGSSAVVHAISAAVERSGAEAVIGIGAVDGDFGAAYRQAVACVRLARSAGTGSQVVHADRLGPMRFLLDAPDLQQVRSMVREQLGPLIDQDHAEMLPTLRAFIAADGQVSQAADACFVHKNTLRYRLQRVAEVLGRDPSDPEVKFQLRMAFDLVDLFESLGVHLFEPPRTPAGLA